MSSTEEAPLEWHRVNRMPRQMLWSSAVLVTFGGSGIGAAFVSRLAESTAHVIALVSACTLFAGLVLAVGSAFIVIQEDAYLAVRRDGMLLHWSRDKEALVPWADVTDIVADEGDASVTIATEGGESHAWSVRRGAVELAGRLLDAKKKADYGILG